MACCAALALLLGLLRGAWFRVFPGRRPPEPGFAPPARRTAGGTAPAEPVRGTAPRRARIAGSLLLGVAYGTAAYALAITLARATPLLRTLDGPWPARDVAVVLLAGTALAAGLVLRAQRSVPALLMGAGAAWTELGLVDMHLLGLFELRVAVLPLDLLLHGSGPLLMVLAARRLALPRPTGARPA